MILYETSTLSKAVEVQKRCYKFLQLIKNDRLPLTGGWTLDGLHSDSTTEAERFKELVLAHFTNLPEDSRPFSTAENDLSDFANFFVSYLICSFDLVVDKWLVQTDGFVSSAALCWCDMCARLVEAPNLKLKKVTGRDKAIANSLEADAVGKLLAAENLGLSEDKQKAVLNDADFAETRALAAYGIELIRRCQGEYVDTSALVLWRRFAWDKSATPKKNFTLTVELIEEAEERLLSRLKQLAGA